MGKDIIMNKIIMFTGGVETLSYFSEKMAEFFVRKGKAVFFYDLKSPGESSRRVRKFIKQGDTILITFNFQGLSMEDCLYNTSMSTYIWQEYNIPCINIAADHPYYYDKQLTFLPEKFILENYIHISIDRLHEKYFKEYYPEFKSGGFLPLAGSRLHGENELKKIIDRDIDILFPGNYTPPEICEKYAHMINEEYAEFYLGIIDDLLKHPYKTVEEAGVCHTLRELGEVAYDDMRKVLNKMIFIDLYVRNYYRGLVIGTLADAGLKVHVIGKGWEKLKCSHKENIIITQFSDSFTCMKAMENAKIVVNVMPWFKDGAHDRVFNAVLNGAVSVSDVSRFQKEEMPEGCGVTYYDLENISRLPQQVRNMLSDTDTLQRIADAGYEKAKRKHTWENRAEMLLDSFVNI